MPYYRNKVDRKVKLGYRTIMLEFHPLETQLLDIQNLHKLHPNYIDLVTQEEINRGRAELLGETVTEEVVAEPVVKKNVVKNEKMVAEVKEPAKNKELLSEPVKEGKGVKKSRKKKTVLAEKKKTDEGYNQIKKEVTVATSGK